MTRRTSPGPGRRIAVGRGSGRALRTAVVVAILAAGLCARADPDGAAVVDLQRQVNDLRSDLLDERERRIERWQEANAFVLVFLGVAIGIDGLWTYARFRSIADQASIGAASARRYMAVLPDMLAGTEGPRGQLGDGSGPLRYLVAPGPEATPASVPPPGAPGPPPGPPEGGTAAMRWSG